MKKPTRVQYFFAQDWPLKIWMAAFPLGVASVAVHATDFGLRTSTDWRCGLWTLGIIVLALLLGFFMGILLMWPILGPIYCTRELINGGPFNVGDNVQILVGPQRGEVSQVYATWQGNSVRVRLSEDEEENFKDIFSPAQLLKEKDAEQNAGEPSQS